MLNSLHAGYFFMHLLSSADFLSELTFSKNSSRNTIRVSNSLDPDKNRHSTYIMHHLKSEYDQELPQSHCSADQPISF